MPPTQRGTPPDSRPRTRKDAGKGIPMVGNELLATSLREPAPQPATPPTPASARYAATILTLAGEKAPIDGRRMRPDLQHPAPHRGHPWKRRRPARLCQLAGGRGPDWT